MIELQLKGLQAREAAETARQVCGAECPDWTLRIEEPRPPGEDETRDVDPAIVVGITALVMAAPSTVDATLNLIERAKLVDRLSRLFQRLRAVSKSWEVGALTVRLPNGRARPIGDVDAEEVVEALAELRRANQERGRGS